MIKKQNSLCISIRSLKRSQYLKRCLNSLACNTDLDDVDFFFIQDGAVNPFSRIRYATDKEIKECIKIIKDIKLPNKTLFVKKHNTGTAMHKELQLNYLFPKYEYAIMADNDLIFNKYYIKTLKVLFKQFKNNPKAGMIQTSFKHNGYNFQGKEEAKKLEDKVCYGFSHRWEQGFWRESAEKIKPLTKPYFDLIRKCDFRELFINNNVYQNVRNRIKKMYNNAIAGDHILEICTQRAGYLGVHTKTLRHKTIGKEGGYSFRNKRFENGYYGKINLYNIGNSNKYLLI